MASELAQRILSGDARAVARGISLVEDDDAAGAQLVREVYAHSTSAFVVGVTGAPGAGKSTLVDRLVQRWRTAGRSVGVLAVDPTSPYTGGAMLGDRVRMQAHAQDSGVFIRSMATRGHLGGLARATGDAATILAASGKDIVAIETVGVGQDEVDVVRAADVAVVVLVPGMGDDVQALKAGVMEIADIFAVNKSDRDAADRTVADVEALLSLHSLAASAWRPPIVRTIATTGVGVDDLISAIDQFHDRAEIIERKRLDRASGRLRSILLDRALSRIQSTIPPDRFNAAAAHVAEGAIDPYTAAEGLLG